MQTASQLGCSAHFLFFSCHKIFFCHSFTLYSRFYLKSGSHGLLQPIPADIGRRQGHIETNNPLHSHSHTPTDNLEFPIHLTRMLLDCAHTDRRRTSKLYAERTENCNLLAVTWQCSPLCTRCFFLFCILGKNK